MIDGRIAHLGLDALARARSHSDRVIADVATVVRDLVRSHDTGGRGVGWVAIGSAARREMTSESDLDLIMLVEGPPPSGEQLVSLRKLDQDIREGLRDRLNLDVSLGSDLTSMTFTDDLRHLGDIRGERHVHEAHPALDGVSPGVRSGRGLPCEGGRASGAADAVRYR